MTVEEQVHKVKARRILRWLVLVALVAAAGCGGWYWWLQRADRLPEGITATNGRVESEEVEIAAKLPGRIAEILVREGDTVAAGQVVARMDQSETLAELQSAQAQLRLAESKRAAAAAATVQRTAQVTYAEQEYRRAQRLLARGWETVERSDERKAALDSARAARDAAIADEASAVASIDASRAAISQIRTQLDDMILVAPRRGRIEYRLAQPGEVVGAGGRVLTLLDLTDVYMTIFVPSAVASRLSLGDEARVILDPVPQYVVPSKVTFVASEAQFTPKAVETEEERAKLMFRVKLTIPPELLQKYERQVKLGIRGMGYVRAPASVPWPPKLAVHLPQ